MSIRVEPGSIVVAVDGSDHAERAVRWAAEQASLEQRRLVVVSVAPPEWFEITAVGAPGLVFPSEKADPLDSARVITESAVAAAQAWRPGISVTGLEALGEPREILVALSQRAHLLVMGSRGRGTFASGLLGSVSAAVSKLTNCPLVVCRPGRSGDRGIVKRGVLVGADGTPESRPVLEFAFRHASQRRLRLTVLHSSWDVVATVLEPHVLSDRDVTAELLTTLSESVAGFAEKFPDVAGQRVLTRGFADECLAAGSQRWDLVVVGRQPISAWARYVARSVAVEVLEHVRTTVAVVPQPARP